jgi:hypothetical protein
MIVPNNCLIMALIICSMCIRRWNTFLCIEHIKIHASYTCICIYADIYIYTFVNKLAILYMYVGYEISQDSDTLYFRIIS